MTAATVTVGSIKTSLLLNKDEDGYYIVFYPDALPSCCICGCDNWLGSFNDCEMVCPRCGETFKVEI
jgi:hypothetical protein